jgi:hypothetical protein
MTNKTFFKESANDKQIGGDHYKLKIQPFNFKIFKKESDRRS